MSTSTRQESCEERIGAHKDGRLADFHALMDVARGNAEDYSVTELETMGLDASSSAGRTDDDALMEQAQERIWEYPLGVSAHTVHRVELSYGGPQDYLEAHVDEDGDIQRITYHFLDWFDGAVTTLSGDEFETAADFMRQIIPEL